MTARLQALPEIAATDTVDRDTFVAGMRRLAGACSVVTAHDGDCRVGLTASSVTSVTAEPATLLVCVHQAFHGWDVLRAANGLVVNVLGAHHEAIARRFAGIEPGVEGDARFDGARWYPSRTGAPILDGALVAFDCRIADAVPVGTHEVLLCEVLDVVTGGDADGDTPLVYYNRSFLTTAALGSVDGRVTTTGGLPR